MKQFGNTQMLEVIELGKPQPLAESVKLLLRTVERWGADGSLKDDVSILGLEVRERAASTMKDGRHGDPATMAK